MANGPLFQAAGRIKAPSRGNLLTDLSSAFAGFVGGSLERQREKEKKARQAALDALKERQVAATEAATESQVALNTAIEALRKAQATDPTKFFGGKTPPRVESSGPTTGDVRADKLQRQAVEDEAAAVAARHVARSPSFAAQNEMAVFDDIVAELQPKFPEVDERVIQAMALQAVRGEIEKLDLRPTAPTPKGRPHAPIQVEGVEPGQFRDVKRQPAENPYRSGR